MDDVVRLGQFGVGPPPMARHRSAFHVTPTRIVDLEPRGANTEERLALPVVDALEPEASDATKTHRPEIAALEAGLLTQLAARAVLGRLGFVEPAAGREPPRPRLGASGVG